MVEEIDWDEFKEFRCTSTKKQDNFMMMLDFLKNYYKLFNVFDKSYNLNKLFSTDIYKSFFIDMEMLNYSKYNLCQSCKDYYRA